MLALARGGFSTQQVDDALHGVSGRRTFTFRYDLYSSALALKQTLNYCSAGSVTFSAEQPVQRTCSFTMREDPSNVVAWGSDRVQPVVQVAIPGQSGTADFPLGMFWLASPGRTISAGGRILRQVQGYDGGQVLQDFKRSSRYYLGGSTQYTVAVGNLLTEAGITGSNIATSAAVMPVGRDWAPATPQQQVINDLLTGINYYYLWFNGSGIAQVQPFVLPPSRPVAYTLATDSRSVIGMGSADTVDYFGVPNRWIVTISQPDRPGQQTAVVVDNTSATSPTGQTARGRVILAQIQAVDAADGTTALAQGQRLAYYQSQVYETVDLELGLMPQFEDHDIVALNHTRLGISANFEVRGWQIALAAGQPMHLFLRALNPIS